MNDSLSENDINLGYPVLKVKEIDSQLSFYTEVLGLKIVEKKGNYYFLSAVNSSNPLLSLHYDEESKNPSQNEAGLYHFAIKLPGRKDLASVFLYLIERDTLFDGFADHMVSEALYLHDKEGNGIEIYCDRPQDSWTWKSDGTVEMATLPLNVGSLLAETSNSSPIPKEAKTGHYHLKVTNLENSLLFYTEKLGLKLKAKMYKAAFLALGKYHHHIGINTWETENGEARDNQSTGLEALNIFVSKNYFYLLDENKSNKTLTLSDPDNIKIQISSE